MTVPNRNYSSPSYRYGFQGQEKDDEIKGNGNSLNYKFRMHDPRVGRFFAVDPLSPQYAHYTPYSFSGNKVISHRELEGLEEENTNEKIPKEDSNWATEGIANIFANFVILGNEYQVLTGRTYSHEYGEIDTEDYIMNGITGINNVFSDASIITMPAALTRLAGTSSKVSSKLQKLKTSKLAKTSSLNSLEKVIAKAKSSTLKISLIKVPEKKLILRMRDRLLGGISNKKLKSTIDRLWRPLAKVGSGSTGDAIRAEKNGMKLPGSTNHLQKAKEGLNTMRDLLKGNFDKSHGKLNEKDRKVVFEVIDDLTKDTGLEWQGLQFDYLKNKPIK